MQVSKRTIAKYIATAALVLCIVVNASTALLSTLGLRDALGWMPFATLEVTSNSMEPMFTIDDVLLVYEAPYDTLTVGDVVTFHGDDEFITHQIVEVQTGGYVTQGLANDQTDGLMTDEEYCAKLVLVLPNCGVIYRALQTPVKRILICFMLLFAVYGIPLLTALVEKTRFQPGGRQRALLCAALISAVCVTPYMTAAKYTAVINKFTTISAAFLSFEANYLSEEGNNYLINTWDGKEYSFSLQISGSSNDLLYNGDGQDLYYGMAVYIYGEDALREALGLASDDDALVLDADDYTVTVSIATTGNTNTNFRVDTDGTNETIAASVPYTYPDEWLTGINTADGSAWYTRGVYFLEGDDGKEGIDQSFTVTVTLDDDVTIEDGQAVYLAFDVVAQTSQEEQFNIALSGHFTFNKSDVIEFIASNDHEQTGNLITRTITTSQITDSAVTEKYVLITWNTNLVYINEYETTVYGIRTSSKNSYWYNKEEGYLIVNMKEYSKIALQFFVIDDQEVTASDFTVAAYDTVTTPDDIVVEDDTSSDTGTET